MNEYKMCAQYDTVAGPFRPDDNKHQPMGLYQSVPPWQLVKPIVNMDLTKLPKSSTNLLVFQQHFSELKTNYTNYVSISPTSIPYSDTKHAVSSYIKSLRQEKWNNETHNKLHHFQP